MWVGGYWHWDAGWVWARGHWSRPPRAGYIWHAPYYENRNGVVIFVGGHWRSQGRVFVPPPPSYRYTISVARPRLGVIIGVPPVGPRGVFVPPPPGSRAGVIVPAPIGTHPGVVMRALEQVK